MNYRKLVIVSILTIILAGMTTILTNNPTTAHAEDVDVNVTNTNWEEKHQNVSFGTSDALRPAVAASPDGKTVLVVYTTQMAGDNENNLYYSFSNANGKPGTWTQNIRLNNSNAVSTKPDVTFDQNNMAHVVWTEGSGIAYARSVSSNLSEGFNTPTIFPNAPSSDPGASDPSIITSRNHVHIIWAEGDGSSSDPKRFEQNIYHRHSTDNGVNWGSTYTAPNTVTFSEIRHLNPTVAVDPSGNLHVLYDNQFAVGLTIREQVKYVKGTLIGNSITWPAESEHTDITTDMSETAPNYDVVEPDIIYANGRLEASVTQKYDAASENQRQQYIFHIGCADSCDTEEGWQATQVSEISPLYVDVSPYSLVSSISRLGGCLKIVFDGKISPSSSDSEQIFLSDSCNSWGDNLKELTINDESRTIQPALVSQNNWWSYIVYEEFVGDETADKQILFVRNQPAVYLPVVIK